MKIAVDLLERLAQEAYDRGLFSGCLLLAKNEAPLCCIAKGTANLEAGRTVVRRSVFNLASVSKQFTAAAVLLLVQDGKLSLDDTFEKYLPEIGYRGRTIRQLLNHTCGLPDYMDWVDALSRRTNTIPGNSVIAEFLKEAPSPELFAPGERFAYSNTGYAALAWLIAQVSGRSFGDFLTERIFQPAGLERTNILHIYQGEKPPTDFAYGYVLENGVYTLPEASERSRFAVTLDGIEGDGAVCSCADDLLTWDSALRAGKVLPRALQHLMYTPTRYGKGQIQNYGFGWNITDHPVLGRMVFHGGSWPGYDTKFLRCLDSGYTLVILMNQSGCDKWGRRSFLDGVNNILMGGELGPIVTMQEKVRLDIDVEAYRPYCGEYENGIRVWLEDDALYVEFLFRAEQVIKTRLYPSGNDTFVTDLSPQVIKINTAGITGNFEHSPKTYRKL